MTPCLKYCPKCGTAKKKSEFYNAFSRSDGLTGWCKICHNKSCKKWSKKNPVSILKAHKKWMDSNPERNKDIVRANAQKWAHKNPERYRYLRKRWAENNKDKVRAAGCKCQQLIRSSVVGKIHGRMSYGIWNALHKNKNEQAWESVVGYTVNDLRVHLESKFTTGMTWDAFMDGDIHVDHIVPKSFFIFVNVSDQEFQYCWSLDNLRPLWAKDNFKKAAKINKDFC